MGLLWHSPPSSPSSSNVTDFEPSSPVREKDFTDYLLVPYDVPPGNFYVWARAFDRAELADPVDTARYTLRVVDNAKPQVSIQSVATDLKDTQNLLEISQRHIPVLGGGAVALRIDASDDGYLSSLKI